MTRRTRASVFGLTRTPPLITRETVVLPTPACFATSLRVGSLPFFIGMRGRKLRASRVYLKNARLTAFSLALGSISSLDLGRKLQCVPEVPVAAVTGA